MTIDTTALALPWIQAASRGDLEALDQVLRAIAVGDITFDAVKATALTLGGTLITPSAAEINTLDNPTLATPAGAGITGGTGTVYKTAVRKVGDLFFTTIMLDLTGLSSSTTDLDIIGQGASVAHLGQITAALNGTILAVAMTCLEAPAGGVTDIDLYSAVEATGLFDGGIAALVETALITSGGAWTNGITKGATTVPAADEYLYLTGGAAGTASAYTAGKFRIEIIGY